MDGIPWQAATAIITPLVGGLVWLGKKAWTLIEAHAERRTKGIEAIAPSIGLSFDKMQKHVTEHADEHTKTVEDAERKIVAAVDAAKAEIVDKIALSARLERVEGALLKGKSTEDPNALERSDRPSRSSVQPLRQSQSAIGAR